MNLIEPSRSRGSPRPRSLAIPNLTRSLTCAPSAPAEVKGHSHGPRRGLSRKHGITVLLFSGFCGMVTLSCSKLQTGTSSSWSSMLESSPLYSWDLTPSNMLKIFLLSSSRSACSLRRTRRVGVSSNASSSKAGHNTRKAEGLGANFRTK